VEKSLFNKICLESSTLFLVGVCDYSYETSPLAPLQRGEQSCKKSHPLGLGRLFENYLFKDRNTHMKIATKLQKMKAPLRRGVGEMFASCEKSLPSGMGKAFKTKKTSYHIAEGLL
tara:strand:+ start:6796 stop:7143 length:348 start_codon:yes stop_codon:yes gene_type:complete